MTATMLLLLALATCAALFVSWRRRAHDVELGTVSAHWLAERRASDGDYYQR